jgi:hypothetical protein
MGVTTKELGIGVLKAARELDALVAERVMGLWSRHALDTTRLGETVGYKSGRACPVCLVELDGEDDPGQCSVKPYSTSISAAWEVVEKLQEFSFELIYLDGKMHWEATFAPLHLNETRAIAETAPLAICKAALKAVDVRKSS